MYNRSGSECIGVDGLVFLPLLPNGDVKSRLSSSSRLVAVVFPATSSDFNATSIRGVQH